MKKKVLGILGGMGPLATSYFFQKLLYWTYAEKDQDYLRIIIDNNIDIPSRTRCLLYDEESPVNSIRESCFNLLKIGCDYIAVPCNSAHYFYDEVVRSNEIPWISMVDIISNELSVYDNVLILGGYATIKKRIYDKFLHNNIYLTNNNLVYNIIEDIKSGISNVYRLDRLYDIINTMDVDCVLLGCTELPIFFDKKKVSCGIVDGNEVYIKKLIQICGGVLKT